MRAQDLSGQVRDFTPDEVPDRDPARRTGPRLPGVGIAQWTSRRRTEGLFRHVAGGRKLGLAILSDPGAHMAYLVSEQRAGYRRVDACSGRPGSPRTRSPRRSCCISRSRPRC